MNHTKNLPIASDRLILGLTGSGTNIPGSYICCNYFRSAADYRYFCKPLKTGSRGPVKIMEIIVQFILVLFDSTGLRLLSWGHTKLPTHYYDPRQNLVLIAMKYLTRPKAQNTRSYRLNESREFKNDSNLAFKIKKYDPMKNWSLNAHWWENCPSGASSKIFRRHQHWGNDILKLYSKLNP